MQAFLILQGDFGCLWMGNAAKGGMEIYTPVHIGCMCYVSGCNLHGGYNRMLSMIKCRSVLISVTTDMSPTGDLLVV